MERENSFSQAMLADAIKTNITSALKEDLGKSDLTSNLLKKNIKGQVHIKTKEKGILCGKAWVDECFKQIDKNIKIIMVGRGWREHKRKSIDLCCGGIYCLYFDG